MPGATEGRLRRESRTLRKSLDARFRGHDDLRLHGWRR